MSLNSSGPANTSVAEMRERRRQKILQNAEERISKILTAHGERRQAPTLDGVTHGADNGGETAPPVELTSNGGWTPVTDDGDGQFRPSNFHWFFDHHRLSAAASFGVLLRLLVHFDMVRSVALTFLPAFIACQFFSHFRRFSNDVTFNAHNSLMTHFLLVYGVNERIVRLGVLIFDVFWQFVTDFCSTTFAFLATHCLIIVLKLFWEQRGGGAVPKVAVAAVGLLPSGFGGVEEAKRARLFVDRRRAPPASPWRASWSCLKSSAAARDGRTWRWWQLWAPRAASEPMEGELEMARLFVDRRRAPPASPWRASWSCLKSSAAARDGRTWRWWQLWALLPPPPSGCGAGGPAAVRSPSCRKTRPTGRSKSHRWRMGRSSTTRTTTLVKFLLVCGLNERIVRLGALIFDVFWQFVTDFCSTTFASFIEIILPICCFFLMSQKLE